MPSLCSDSPSKSVGARFDDLGEHRHRDDGEGEERQDDKTNDHQGEQRE